MDSLATYHQNCELPGISLQLGAQYSDLMDYSKLIEQVMKAMSILIACQVVAEFDVKAIAMTPSLAQDSIFSHILSPTVPLPNKNSKIPTEEANNLIINMLRVAMELQATEKLGTCSSTFSSDLWLTEGNRYQRASHILRYGFTQ